MHGIRPAEMKRLLICQRNECVTSLNDNDWFYIHRYVPVTGVHNTALKSVYTVRYCINMY